MALGSGMHKIGESTSQRFDENCWRPDGDKSQIFLSSKILAKASKLFIYFWYQGKFNTLITTKKTKNLRCQYKFQEPIPLFI